MSHAETLRRVAAVLKDTIAPAVGDEYATTQAHMAAVVLGKIAAELELGPEQAAARATDEDELVARLSAVEPAPGGETGAALVALLAAPGDEALEAFVAAIHADRDGLDDATRAALLAPVRHYLRRELDRRLESAR